jgi:hypothetical protein
MEKQKVIVSELEKDIIEALDEQEQTGSKLLNITENDTPKQIVERIKDFVENILVKNHTEDELKEYSFQLGTIWGKMVEKEYDWTWKNIDFGDGNVQFYLLSPKEYYCCNPLYFLHKILTGANAGLDGKNDNTVLLLFNMLDGIEKQEPAKKYQVLS